MPSHQIPQSMGAIDWSIAHQEPQVASSAKHVNKLRSLRAHIGIYILLWLVEGGLRRWVLPDLATPLLIVRDPIVLLIYYRAYQYGVFPRGAFVASLFVLAPISWILAVTAGHGDVLVATYGVRCDFMHVPLVFVIARVLQKKDLDRLFRVALWISIPYTALLVLQFYSPQSAWVNRGVGGDMEGAGFSGALGRFRPPGTFSFTTGVSQLYALISGVWFYLFIRRKASNLLLLLSGGSILLAVPLSISRTLFVSVAIISFAGIAGIVASGKSASNLVFRIAVIGLIVASLITLLPATDDAVEAFSARWKNSTTNRGGVGEALIGRILDDLTRPFSEAPMLGYGTGISTQVGQKLATGTRGFGYSEGEWGRILAEGGLLFGSFILGYRLLLFVGMTRQSFQAVSRGRGYVLPLWAAAAPLVLVGQWGQSTTLGSAVIALGLCLVAAAREAHQSRIAVYR